MKDLRLRVATCGFVFLFIMLCGCGEEKKDTVVSQDRNTEVIREKRLSLESFLRREMLDSEGSVKTNADDTDRGLPSGEDSLIESQGMLMEYAVLAEDRGLFELVWEGTRRRYNQDGLLPWVESEKAVIATNALIDDLRVINALMLAEEKWGRKEPETKGHISAILRYNTMQGSPRDFYDTQGEVMAEDFTLCYGNLPVLQKLGKRDRRWKQVYQTTQSIMKNGYIGAQFPFYYPSYRDETRSYQGGTLHMAEALTCVLYLAQAGGMRKETLDWLRQAIHKGAIYGIYGVDGHVCQNGDVESASIYALSAMIAMEAQDEELASLFIDKMETFRIEDESSRMYGAFGKEDELVYSYDQLTVLLAYLKWEAENK